MWQQPIAQAGPNPETGDASASSGAVGGGRLYQAGGTTTINGVSYAGSVRALDLGTGTVLWAQGTASPVIAAVAYANGLVVDGAGAVLEVRDASSGALLYSHTLGGAIYGAPSVAYGHIYVGTKDGTLTAFGLAPALTVTPPSGIFPQTLILSGTAFTANEVVHVYDQSVSATPLYTGTADTSGTVVMTGTFPLSVYGAHTLVALGQTSGLTATATYTVKPGLLLRPLVGTGGATAVVSGSGFGAHEAVTLYWDRPLQSVGATTSSTVGAFYGATGVTITIPVGTTAGWHLIYGLGQATHALGVGMVYVY